MIKKIIYAVILIGVVAVGYFTFRFFSGRQTQPGSQIQSGLLPNSSIPPRALPADYSITSTFPTTPTVTIGTKDGNVEMKNFYATAVDTEEGMVILKNNDQYEIAYDRGYSSFLIYLRNPSLKDTRQNAEADFLSILGIGQADACKLNVRVQAPSGQSVGENKNLSFCLNKL